MKKLKKALSLLLAGVVAATAMLCGSVSASAASSKTALLKTALTQIDSRATDVAALGQDLYMFFNDTYNAVYRIGSDEIKNWRSTGKLKATKIAVDPEVAKTDWDYYTDITFEYGDYALWGYYKNDNTITKFVMKYDKANKKITKVYSTDNYIGISGDGSMSEFIYDSDKGKLTLKILNNKAKLVKQLSYDFSAEDTYSRWAVFRYGSDTACISYYRESEADLSSNEGIKGGHIITVDKNGKTKTVADNLNRDISVGNNYITFDRRPLAGRSYVYLTSKGKGYGTFGLRRLENEVFKTDGAVYVYTINDFGKKIYGTKAVAEYVAGPDEDLQYKYALVNISSDKFISAVYDDMSTSDNGEMFLVKNSKGQWGYLNSKGKKLAMFDDAGAFTGSGKYAPVIKNGKIYLVDKNMKQVSKTIKADDNSYLNTLGDELFLYTYGGKTYLMTNKK
ncbi:MAG: hypothetical protein J6O50_08265 [Ruminiclostridium sp.]|nr:hypothetical protein [Ruminiclostridium sp.]